ncbi:hypothetical protein [Marivirga sp.]|uniref:hypothetical protein n=1 Tax=Marivirga sp. TaxID=2018662 RepID=UPI002D80A898|nr:hypothetical protein [Marivirga sp.]HET8861472.1 hypothetical protein [Marivirga sp.]
MDLALKKIELIDWLKDQDQNIIDQIDEIRKSELLKRYSERMGQDVGSKLKRSNLDIIQGHTKSQKEVEALFKNRK